MWRVWAVVLVVLLAGCSAGGGPAETVSPTDVGGESVVVVTDSPTASPTETQSATDSPTETPSPTASPTRTATPSPTASPTPTPEPTATPALSDSVSISEASVSRVPRLDTNDSYAYQVDVTVRNSAGREATVEVWAAIEYTDGGRRGQLSPDTATVEIDGSSSVDLRWTRNVSQRLEDPEAVAKIESVE